jgi:hypothetical protein
MRMRCWGRSVVAAVAATVGSLLASAPSGAAPSHPGGVPDTCPEVLSHGPTGGLEKFTAPPPGSEVPRGAVITVTLRWDREAFAGATLHKVLDCVTVDGTAADTLSVQVRDPANVGEFALTVTVPDDLPDGTRLCDRGFVSGTGPDGTFVREKSNDVCFTVRGDGSPRPAPPSGAAPVATPAGPTSAAPAPDVSTPDIAVPGRTPTVSLPEPPSPAAPPLVPAPPVDVVFTPAPGPGDSGAGPAGEPTIGADVAGMTEVADDAVPTLPRTGTSVIPLVAGGLGAIVAGLTALSAGRRLRRSPASRRNDTA